jgi:spermidine synthase
VSRPFLTALIAAPLIFGALRLLRPAFGFLPGELLGPGFMAATALGLGLTVAFPFGAVFTASASLGGGAGRVYLWESAGAAGGGLIASFVLIPVMSNGPAAAISGFALLLFLRLTIARRARILPFATAALLFTALLVLDVPSQRLAWKPFSLIHVEDTRYGRIQVIQTDEQISFYSDGTRSFSTADPASAEEAVHFALLQAPNAEQILLIGGGPGGNLAEILKYPQTQVEDVEFDPAFIRLADRFLPESDRRALHDPRVRFRIEDGRMVLSNGGTLFDVILADIPAPTTARTNRYFTLEFFRDVRARLRPGGVLGFRVPSAENYQSPELINFLRSIRTTLSRIFPEVAIVPGGTNVFLASDRPLSLDPDVLSERARQLGLRNAFVNPAMLPARLDPIRVQRLRATIGGRDGDLNTDTRPIGYLRESILWRTQFRSSGPRMMARLASVPASWLLGIGLALATIVLVGLRFRPNRSTSTAILGPLAVLGLTTIAVEIASITWFQALHGSVYESLAFLLAAFMTGLTAGSAVALQARKPRFFFLTAIQIGLLGLLLGAWAGLVQRPSPIVFAAYLFFVGAAAGAIFVFANALFIRDSSRAGLGYAGELLGGFLGAWAITAVLIPLAGLSSVFLFLMILNAISLLVLVSLRKHRSN